MGGLPAGGRPRPARELYAAAVKRPDNRDLLRAVGGPPAALRRALDGRLAAVSGLMVATANRALVLGQPAGGEATPADLAVVLLAEAAAPAAGGQAARIAAGSVARLLMQPALKEAVAGRGPAGPPVRALLYRWMDSLDEGHEVMTAHQLAGRLGLPAADVARWRARWLGVAGLSPHVRAMLACELAQGGSADHLPALTRLFADDSTLPMPTATCVQLRDVALALAAQMTGQDPAGYGMQRDKPFVGNTTGYRFASDDQRQAAFARWAEWERASARAAAAGPAAWARP